MKSKIKWLNEPENHNYPAAESYLSLILDSGTVKLLVKKLKNSDIVEFKSKDIFRASRLPMLTRDNYHVNSNLKKIESEEKLSPILLVRDIKNRITIIADGYHRMCAVHTLSEDLPIPCKIVTLK